MRSLTLSLLLIVGLPGLTPALSNIAEAASDKAVSTVQSPEQHGLEIARRIRAARVGFAGEQSNIELILINASGDRITRRMISWVMELADDGDRSVITFQWPADVRDTRLLTQTHRHSDDDQWLYLPSVERIKRINSSNKSGSFMGSEFVYEDLASQEVEKYTYKYLREEAFAGRSTWVIERYPVDKSSGYSKQILWYDKEYMNPLRIEFFDRKGEPLKTMTFEDYRMFDRWWRAGRIRIENVQTEKASIMVWKDRELKAQDPRHFVKEALGD